VETKSKPALQKHNQYMVSGQKNSVGYLYWLYYC